MGRIQVVWWWRRPCFKWYPYPNAASSYYTIRDKPLFWGLYLGIIEFRFWPVEVIEVT